MLWAGPALAECRLALLLALDISSSVDAAEDRLQREGLAAALVSDEVVQAILSVPGRHVSLAVFEWSGRYQQNVTLGWRALRSEADIVNAAGSITSSRRPYIEFPTALGYAMGYAASVFATAPPCAAQTLNVSGDGENNEGFGPRLAYKHFPLADVTVNGLVIGDAEDLKGYYQREVIKGPGAFVIEARDFLGFQEAMTRKLVRETSMLAVSELRASEPLIAVR